MPVLDFWSQLASHKSESNKTGATGKLTTNPTTFTVALISDYTLFNCSFTIKLQPHIYFRNNDNYGLPGQHGIFFHSKLTISLPSLVFFSGFIGCCLDLFLLAVVTSLSIKFFKKKFVQLLPLAAPGCSLFHRLEISVFL